MIVGGDLWRDVLEGHDAVMQAPPSCSGGAALVAARAACASLCGASDEPGASISTQVTRWAPSFSCSTLSTVGPMAFRAQSPTRYDESSEERQATLIRVHGSSDLGGLDGVSAVAWRACDALHAKYWLCPQACQWAWRKEVHDTCPKCGRYIPTPIPEDNSDRGSWLQNSEAFDHFPV